MRPARSSRHRSILEIGTAPRPLVIALAVGALTVGSGSVQALRTARHFPSTVAARHVSGTLHPTTNALAITSSSIKFASVAPMRERATGQQCCRSIQWPRTSTSLVIDCVLLVRRRKRGLMSKRPVSIERGCRVIAASLLCAMAVTAASDVAAATSTSPTAWTTQFCKALQTWGDKVNTINAQLQSTAASVGGDLAQSKTMLVDDIEQIADTTGHAAQIIQRAGVPAVPNGKKMSAAFVNGFKNGEQQLLRAATEAKALSTDDAAAFLSGMSTVATKLQVDPISPAFKSARKLDESGKIGRALVSNPDCKFLRE